MEDCICLIGASCGDGQHTHPNKNSGGGLWRKALLTHLQNLNDGEADWQKGVRRPRRLRRLQTWQRFWLS